MSYNLLKNTSLYSIGTILPKAASFILLPIYTSFLSVDEYGIISAMIVFNAFLTILITLNIERSIFRLYYDYETAAQKKEYIGTVFISILCFSTIMIGVMFLTRDYISLIYKSIDFYPYFLISIFTVYVGIYGSMLRVLLQVIQKVKLFVMLGIVQFIISSLLILLFVVYFKEGAYGYLKGVLFGNLIMVPIFLKLLLPHINFKFNRVIIINTLKYSLPIVPAVLAGQIIDLSDRIFIENYFSSLDLGLYSLGYTIAGVVLVVTGAFKKAYDPFFYKIANSKTKAVSLKILTNTNEAYYIITIFICFSITLVSKEMIYWFFPKSYFIAYKIVPVISLAYAVSKISGLINLSFYQEKKTLKLMELSIYAAILNVALNFILIPLYGYYGAAIATLITFLFMLIIKYYLSKKYYFLPINWILLVSVIFFMIFIYLFFNHFVNLPLAFSFTLKIFTLFILLVAIYLLKKEQFKEIFNYE
jgi:O-antigen/teichoic acid export membrane protein